MTTLALVLLLAGPPTTVAVPIPGVSGGVGCDDLGFSRTLHRVIVPGGRTGNLDLIDPATREITTISGLSKDASYGGAHGEGATSANEGRGLLFASDRSSRTLVVVDPAKKVVVASVKLGGAPEYVRYVAPLGEVGVTEPGDSAEMTVLDVAADGKLSVVTTVPAAKGAHRVAAADDPGGAWVHDPHGGRLLLFEESP